MMAPTAKPYSPPTPGNRWPKLGRAVEMGTGICVCVWFFKNLTHFCHVLVHQNSRGGGSVKNALTCNFVTVPVSLGLLPIPQDSWEEPQSLSVPESLFPVPPHPSIHPFTHTSIHPSFFPSILPFSQLRERKNQREQLKTKKTLARGARGLFLSLA